MRVRYLSIPALALTLLASLALAAPVRGRPHPVPAPSITPAPPPVARASARLRHWARAWHRQALLNRRAYQRARASLGLPAAALVPGLPRTTAASDWMAWGRECRELAFRFDAGWRQLYYRLTHPAGSGAARWWPLARYVGWPPEQRANLLLCITRESGGRPWATNGVCDGLLQIHHVHRLAHPFDPEINLAYGLRLWQSVGRHWYPTWVTMAGH